jgi:hypothetical protein
MQFHGLSFTYDCLEMNELEQDLCNVSQSLVHHWSKVREFAVASVSGPASGCAAEESNWKALCVERELWPIATRAECEIRTISEAHRAICWNFFRERPCVTVSTISIRNRAVDTFGHGCKIVQQQVIATL